MFVNLLQFSITTVYFQSTVLYLNNKIQGLEYFRYFAGSMMRLQEDKIDSAQLYLSFWKFVLLLFSVFVRKFTGMKLIYFKAITFSIQNHESLRHKMDHYYKKLQNPWHLWD
jgi:hypothetical protein